MPGDEIADLEKRVERLERSHGRTLRFGRVQKLHGIIYPEGANLRDDNSLTVEDGYPEAVSGTADILMDADSPSAFTLYEVPIAYPMIIWTRRRRFGTDISDARNIGNLFYDARIFWPRPGDTVQVFWLGDEVYLAVGTVRIILEDAGADDPADIQSDRPPEPENGG